MTLMTKSPSKSDEIDGLIQWTKKSNHDIADKYAKVGDMWIDYDNAARLYEETKSSELEARKDALITEALSKGESLADNAAERKVKANPEWRERCTAGVEAGTGARRLKLLLTVLEMRHREQQSREATERALTKL